MATEFGNTDRDVDGNPPQPLRVPPMEQMTSNLTNSRPAEQAIHQTYPHASLDSISTGATMCSLNSACMERPLTHQASHALLRSKRTQGAVKSFSTRFWGCVGGGESCVLRNDEPVKRDVERALGEVHILGRSARTPSVVSSIAVPALLPLLYAGRTFAGSPTKGYTKPTGWASSLTKACWAGTSAALLSKRECALQLPVPSCFSDMTKESCLVSSPSLSF